MHTDFGPDEPHKDGNIEKDWVEHTKAERYRLASRIAETREAEFNKSLEVRYKSADELRQRHLAQLDTLAEEYTADRAQVKKKRAQAKVQLEAAHRSACEHCSEIGVQYVPGKTTGMDALAVPPMEKAEAAKKLDLKYGTGTVDKQSLILKPLLTVLCWVLSSVSIGLSFHLLDARHLVANPLSLLANPLSLGAGGLVSIGVLVAMTKIWKPIGTKIGFGRAQPEVLRLGIPAAVLTAAFFLGLAFLDARTMVLLNAARAALNPAVAVTIDFAFLFGVILSGVYVIGLAFTAFSDGYREAAQENIGAFIKQDQRDKIEKLKEKTPVLEAVEAVSDVGVANEVVRAFEEDLKSLDAEFERKQAELTASLPEVPDAIKPVEQEEVSKLRDRVRSEKTSYDAYKMSAGDAANGHNFGTAKSDDACGETDS